MRTSNTLCSLLNDPSFSREFKAANLYTNFAGNLEIFFDGQADLKIGKFCSISSNIKIFLGGNHRSDWISTYAFGLLNTNIFNKCDGKGVTKTNGDVIIGNDVWIGYNATIMSGVNIGDGAIISANSVVYNNVKPYSVVGGNPATFWFFRFNEETIEKLLELKWWDFSTEIINEISPILCSNDIDKLLEICKQYKQ